MSEQDGPPAAPQQPQGADRSQTNFSDFPAQKFVVELIIDGRVFKSPVAALNEASIRSLLDIAVAANMPRLGGYNLYAEDSTLLASVPAIEFIAQIDPLKQKPQGTGPNPGGVGWRALPLVTPTSEEFQKMVDEMRNQERRGGKDKQ